MRTSISPLLLYIANRVAQIPFMKSLLKPLYYPYKKKIWSNRNRLFQENALKVLADFDYAMRTNNIPYSIFAGTLLGAVREKGFIKHDLDVDTLMFYEDYSPHNRSILENAGFRLQRSFTINEGQLGMEETYEKFGVTIDIYYIYHDDKYPTYQCDFHPEKGCSSCEESMRKYGYVKARRIEFPIEKSFIDILFEDKFVKAIINHNEWLEARYGHDYMIPNPHFSDKGDNPNMFEWEEVKAIYHKY